MGKRRIHWNEFRDKVLGLDEAQRKGFKVSLSYAMGRSFRKPNLRKKKQVRKKIFDNFLNFASKFSLRVTI